MGIALPAPVVRARRHIEERFSWSRIAETLTGIYAGAGPANSGSPTG